MQILLKNFITYFCHWLLLGRWKVAKLKETLKTHFWWSNTLFCTTTLSKFVYILEIYYCVFLMNVLLSSIWKIITRFIVCVCVCVCVCVGVGGWVGVGACVCVCLRPFTVKASSLWISWNTREQINNVMLKTLIPYAKSIHRYFRMQHQTFLTSHFILFTH